MKTARHVNSRALNQVKEARHPFLLSLERIEAISGHLVIVTELADESVKDRFDSHRSQSREGIPRKELIGFLKDAADALDYMSEQHSLQHMDIKPPTYPGWTNTTSKSSNVPSAKIRINDLVAARSSFPLWWTAPTCQRQSMRTRLTSHPTNHTS